MRFILIAVLAAGIGAPCAPADDAAKTPASAAANPAARALKIGYVDISRVWNEYRRRGDFDNDYKTRRLDLAHQDRTRTEEIARYQREIEKLAMGTPERLELEEKAKTAIKETEEFRRKGAEDLNEKFISMLNRLFGEVLQKIEEIAKEGDYDLIIKDQTPDPNVNSRADAVLQLGQRVVLYAKPQYDLTSAVIKRLNDKYEAEQKKKETAPDSPKQPEAPTKEK
jgi:Skp family chaperone for outer membrane proteins